jgi:DNA-binding transcriptional LysR family regulator
VLTLHQLEVFIAVADEMSVGRAAERLHVSQPAVSASIGALQRELGVDLIARSGRGIELTPGGKALQRYASLVLGLVDEAVEASRAAGAQVARAIRIGATSSLVTHVLAPILAQLRMFDPQLAFALEIGNRSQVWKQLANHEVDVAMTTQPPSVDPFVSLATMPNSFVVVARPGAVWAGRLGEVTWLIREEGATARAASDEVLARLGITPPVLVIGSDEAIKGSVEAGLGVGVLPGEVVAESLRHRALVTVRTAATPLSQPWHLVVRRSDRLDGRTRQFVCDLVHADHRLQWTAHGLDATR